MMSQVRKLSESLKETATAAASHQVLLLRWESNPRSQGRIVVCDTVSNKTVVFNTLSEGVCHCSASHFPAASSHSCDRKTPAS